MQNYGTNFRAPKVDVHQFTMIPRAEIPRSTFRMTHQHKTTFSASYLIPIYCQEVLPGDTFTGNMTAFARLATPIYPIMDNMQLETFFFFVPNRIVWSHWVNFMGEQPASPADSISYTIPQVVSVTSGAATATVYDYFGIPGSGQIGVGNTISVNALPFRAYNMIWNQWFRDQNLQTAQGYGATNTVYDIGDGPDPNTNYQLLAAAKRHDYFTAALPWTQKGGVAVTLPLSGNATVKTNATALVSGTQNPVLWQTNNGSAVSAGGPWYAGATTTTGNALSIGTSTSGGAFVTGGGNSYILPTNLYADLSTATASTINAIRLAFQTQRLLERDARGGTRYQELLMSHFGVHPLDARLQRPEYLGGGRTPVNIAPVPQTSGTGASGTSSPIGTLSAVGMAQGGGHGFRASFTEHGHIIGLATVRMDNVYQQGLHRMWTRSTRYDFYWPVFSMLGEQAIRNDEIYCIGGASGQDATAFGYQERWAEYRYYPSRTSGYFRSTASTPLDAWHLGLKFASLPALNSAYIVDATNVTLIRNLAAGGATANQQFLCDLYFDIRAARPLPMYSVPGLLDHF